MVLSYVKNIFVDEGKTNCTTQVTYVQCKKNPDESEWSVIYNYKNTL